jgi:hypothetical protein
MGSDTDNSEIVRVLLVGDRPQSFSLARQVFEQGRCECHFAGSVEAVRDLLDLRRFDIVLSTHTVPGEAMQSLVNLLAGSSASLFSSLRFEEGSWWLPVLQFGKESYGPALRSEEFARVLEELGKQARPDVIVHPVLTSHCF